jgi:23S rRNA pseudouridine1911/1915/1917 synthase
VRQALHADELSLPHPSSGERMRFSAPLPQDLRALIAGLRPLDRA